MNATRVVMVAIIATVTLHIGRLVIEGKDDSEKIMRVTLAGCVLIAVLLLMAEPWPEGAKGLAATIAVTGVLINGVPVFKAIGKLVSE